MEYYLYNLQLKDVVWIKVLNIILIIIFVLALISGSIMLFTSCPFQIYYNAIIITLPIFPIYSINIINKIKEYGTFSTIQFDRKSRKFILDSSYEIPVSDINAVEYLKNEFPVTIGCIENQYITNSNFIFTLKNRDEIVVNVQLVSVEKAIYKELRNQGLKIFDGYQY